MTLYALLICFNGACTLHGIPHSVTPHLFVERPYPTLQSCREALRGNTANLRPDSANRVTFSANYYWECRAKRVEVWEAVR